jgi:hypothetical protein
MYEFLNCKYKLWKRQSREAKWFFDINVLVWTISVTTGWSVEGFLPRESLWESPSGVGTWPGGWTLGN